MMKQMSAFGLFAQERRARHMRRQQIVHPFMQGTEDYQGTMAAAVTPTLRFLQSSVALGTDEHPQHQEQMPLKIRKRKTSCQYIFQDAMATNLKVYCYYKQY